MSDSLERLDQDLAARHLGGIWRLGLEVNQASPATSVRPWHWPWADIHAGLLRAAELVSLEDSERRVVRLLNPADGVFTTHTMQASFSYVKPGEHARAHRHTPAAIRFVVQGHGAYTTVNGQQCLMEPNDLILTPNLSWHDHGNDSDEPIIWLDGLDFPLVKLLQQITFEPHARHVQPVEITSDEVAPLHGHACPEAIPVRPFVHYRWREVRATLDSLSRSATPDPFDGYLVPYRNADTGGPTLPTLQCAAQLLCPGQATSAHRHTSTTVYFVVAGAGSTTVGEQEVPWQRGDVFVVPLWYPHRHRNLSASTEALVFSMSDAPALNALGLLRTEPCD